MRRSTLFFAAAVIALVLGAGPLLSRMYEHHVQQIEHDAQQQRLSLESAQLKAELQTTKPALLTELKRLQAEGLHQEVLAKASHYRLADDLDIRALYTQSAQELSLQQTLTKLARLAAEHCNDAAVRQHLETLMSVAQPSGTPANGSSWTVERLDLQEFMAPIRTQLRAAAAAAQKPHQEKHEHASPADSVAELFDVDDPPRVHPAVAFALMQGKTVDDQVCAWRVRGKADLGALTQNSAKLFDLVLWMAPSATEHGMEYNVLHINGFYG